MSGQPLPLFQVECLSKVYGGTRQPVTALESVSFEVHRGGIFGIVGPSGAGKSTLLRCLNWLEPPTAGRVLFEGVDLASLPAVELRRRRRRIGMIFQQFHLLHSRTVADNVALPLEIHGGQGRAERRQRVAELLELVGLNGREHAHPSQLSGGQKQRVGIARALAASPAVLLCDEATSALDAEATDSVLGLLRDVNRRLGVTIVLITHELTVVKSICTSAALLEAGRLVEAGDLPDLIASPTSRLAQVLMPEMPAAAPGQGQIFDVIFADADATSPAITALAGALNVTVRLLAGGIETIAGRRVGRLQIAVTGTNPVPTPESVLEFLRAGGARVALQR